MEPFLKGVPHTVNGCLQNRVTKLCSEVPDGLGNARRGESSDFQVNAIAMVKICVSLPALWKNVVDPLWQKHKTSQQ